MFAFPPSSAGKTSMLVALVAALSLCFSGVAFATDNTATGDIAGVGGDLTDSNTFTINATTLALMKAAFLTDGTALTSGDNVPAGTKMFGIPGTPEREQLLLQATIRRLPEMRKMLKELKKQVDQLEQQVNSG